MTTVVDKYIGTPALVRIRVGVRFGIVVAAFFAALATLGRIQLGAAEYARHNGPWLPTVLIYFTVLPAAGAVVGALFRLYRYALGAVFLGTIVVFPLLVAFGRLGSMERMPVEARLIAQGILAVVIGGGVALQRWSVDRKKEV